LLRIFRLHFKDLAEAWLTTAECDLIATNKASFVWHTASADVQSRVDADISAEWQSLKRLLSDAQCAPMEELLTLVGLETVKRIAMSIYRSVLADKELRDNKRDNAVVPMSLNFAFMGNPGTGKTTVARLFASLLEQAGARAGHKFVQMTAHEALRKGKKVFASELASLSGGKPGVGPPPTTLRVNLSVEVCASDGKWYPGIIHCIASCGKIHVKYADGTIEEGVDNNVIRAIGSVAAPVGGVLFLDEAYDLNPGSSQDGRAIMAEIMSAAEDSRDILSIILAGYKDEIEQKLYAHNIGMASRFQTIPFDDFTLPQLELIWRRLCEQSGWACSDQVAQVASRRVGRGIGRKGFGNARSVRTLFETAVREAKLRYLDQCCDMKEASTNGDAAAMTASKGDNDTEAPKLPGDIAPEISLVDIIGDEPSRERNVALDRALCELESLVGLERVKQEIFNNVHLAFNNYHRELRAERVDDVVLNRLFLGNPGTGKVCALIIRFFFNSNLYFFRRQCRRSTVVFYEHCDC
jgi:hypothetical protein